jgi:hypothetical protein
MAGDVGVFAPPLEIRGDRQAVAQQPENKSKPKS